MLPTAKATAKVRVARLAAVTAVVALTASAAAQSSADKAAAEQLFNAGRALMAAKKFPEACPKLEASLRLDAALGTRLNLASCYEEVGKLASAWGMYREAADLAVRENQLKRVKFATDRATILEPRLPRLIIAVDANRAAPGLQVTRDGTVVDRAVFGTPIYVDPGPRTVVVEAVGYKPFTTEVVAVEGRETKLDIPALQPLSAAQRRAVAGAAAGVQLEPVPSPGRTRRLTGLAVAGGGALTMAVGFGFGLSAKSKWDRAIDNGLCDTSSNLCTPEGQKLSDTANQRATIATIAVSAGVAMAVTGAVLYFTAPRRDRGSAARLLPGASRDSLSVALVGRF